MRLPRSNEREEIDNVAEMNAKSSRKNCESLMADEEEFHTSCNACHYGVDFVRSGGGKPLRVLQLSWDQILELVEERGRDLVGAEAQELASELTKEKDP